MVKPIERIVPKLIESARVADKDYRWGVEHPERNPIEAALAANDKRIARIKESLDKKTWEKKMEKLTIEDWRKPALEKGVGRFPEGIEVARPKIDKFWRGWHPILSGIQSAVRALPEITDADREKRMIENLRRLKAAKATW